MLLVDTNVLVDVLEDDPDWVEWSLNQLQMQSRVNTMAINPVIYAELSLTFDSVEALDDTLRKIEVQVLEIPRPALFLAGKAFVKYRRRGGAKGNVLSDFFIGAHAAVLGCRILTRDATRYRGYFPGVQLVTPS